MEPSTLLRLRCGGEVHIYTITAGDYRPVHGAYRAGREWHLTSWNDDGSWVDGRNPHQLDLVGYADFKRKSQGPSPSEMA